MLLYSGKLLVLQLSKWVGCSYMRLCVPWSDLALSANPHSRSRSKLCNKPIAKIRSRFHRGCTGRTGTEDLFTPDAGTAPHSAATQRTASAVKRTWVCSLCRRRYQSFISLITRLTIKDHRQSLNPANHTCCCCWCCWCCRIYWSVDVSYRRMDRERRAESKTYRAH